MYRTYTVLMVKPSGRGSNPYVVNRYLPVLNTAVGCEKTTLMSPGTAALVDMPGINVDGSWTVAMSSIAIATS
jgi:hypothetical protein